MVTQSFGSDAKIYLYGSRCHDDQKGGDIDLIIEVSSMEEKMISRKIQVLAALYTKLGEQKIDLLITESLENDHRPVVLEARREALEL